MNTIEVKEEAASLLKKLKALRKLYIDQSFAHRAITDAIVNTENVMLILESLKHVDCISRQR
jgi:hypothetical protein